MLHAGIFTVFCTEMVQMSNGLNRRYRINRIGNTDNNGRFKGGTQNFAWIPNARGSQFVRQEPRQRRGWPTVGRVGGSSGRDMHTKCCSQMIKHTGIYGRLLPV